ncbi:MAG TPA: hypothetical protein ENI23_14185 [bacterium]|nr:hypothetical protein [bacterium]
MTRINPDEFLDEVKRFGFHKTSQNRVRIMQRGNLIFLKFHNPASGEKVETIISREDFERTEFMNWSPIAIPGTWEIEEDRPIQIRKMMEELNGRTATQPNNRNSSIEFRQPSP